MSNPADSLNEVVVDKKLPINKDDVDHFNNVLAFLRNAQRYYGRIKKYDKTTGKYTIDIYSDAQFTAVSHTDITAYTIDFGDNFAVQNRVVCYFIDGTGYIAGMAIPRGTGKYRVLMLIDDENPGTMAFDSPRFI